VPELMLAGRPSRGGDADADVGVGVLLSMICSAAMSCEVTLGGPVRSIRRLLTHLLGSRRFKISRAPCRRRQLICPMQCNALRSRYSSQEDACW